MAIDFTYNTNAIEGSTITKDETRELIEKGISPNKPLRDIQETLNHAKIFIEIMENKYKELSLSSIKYPSSTRYNSVNVPSCRNLMSTSAMILNSQS